MSHEHNPQAVGRFGFWLYLMTDTILFACLFSAYAVLRTHTAGITGPAGLFDTNYVMIETLFLLASSLMNGIAILSYRARQIKPAILFMAITGLLGLGFIVMEVQEFHHLILEGFGPDKSAALSAFFSLVGTHGLHVSVGLLWLVILTAQATVLGYEEKLLARFERFGLFWHFLDLVWIAVFSYVYLLG